MLTFYLCIFIEHCKHIVIWTVK